MKVEVAVLGSPSLIVLNMVSVDVKQRLTSTENVIVLNRPEKVGDAQTFLCACLLRLFD